MITVRGVVTIVMLVGLCGLNTVAWSQETAGAQEEEAALEIPAYEAESDQEVVVDVWWGNRSIAFGNYLRFNRITIGCVGDCTYCDKNMICCKTGCKCAECQYICDDCDNCPPDYFDKVFFDLDKSVLRPDAIEECEKILAYLQTNPNVLVTIEGHCCDLASDGYNIGLGQRRANAVRKYLIDHGIDPNRLQTKTYGESTPWVGVDQRALNRRAVVVPIKHTDR